MANRFRLSLAAAVAALLLAAAGPAAALDLGGHDRDGTVIGLNFGSGWSKLAFTGSDGSDYETGTELAFTGGINVGWARNDNLIGSIGIYGWKESYAQNLTPISVTTFHFLGEVSWFPRGEGFWLKGGAGWGTLDVDAVLPQERVIYQKGGFTWSAGAGYEFRVADTAAIGIQYDYREVRVGQFEFLDNTVAKTHSLTCSLRFYMM
ncbi:MAG TPA: outer membrane beta-barrel protein [Candidatus Krumholzibacteria bacterium]|nr:outer membrane beta-barrel protein [Candidatus Krumholzibacteria bacterium]